MKKKTIRLFYSWQDDLDSKFNRSFIKTCLESALAEINKNSEVEEASRPLINLDHDTKGIPGIPDIANTIRYKISTADIFLADLTFVSEYQNHKGVTKKVSNQNVIFELGFALNALGPSKIICLFNEAFGKPNDLLFDLQHRRWPILFNLSSSDPSAKKTQKPLLIQRLNTAIVSIINNRHPNKTKYGLHNPFSPTQHDEFEYLFKKLNTQISISVNYREKRIVTNWEDHDFDAPERQWQQKNFSSRFIPALTDYIAIGNAQFSQYIFKNYIRQVLESQVSFLNREECYFDFDYNKEELELLIRTLGLVSSSEGKFLQKTYKFIHWLDFNGFKESNPTVVEV